MGSKHRFSWQVLFLVLALAHFSGSSHAKESGASLSAELLGASATDFSSAAARALKSVRGISEGLSDSFAHEHLSGGRHLLAKKKKKKAAATAMCEWEKGKCVISDDGALNLLTKAKSDIAELVLDIVECSEVTSEKKCREPACTWEDGECVAASADVGPAVVNECVGDASVFLDNTERSSVCTALSESATECNANDDCFWSEGDSECGFNVFKMFLGVPLTNGLPLGFTEALLTHQQWLLEASIADGIPLVNDPDEILEWDPEPFPCPKEFEQALCDAVAPFKDLFTASLYCGTKFPAGGFAPQACDADPLCGVDEDGQCSPSLEVLNKFASEAWQAFANAAEDPAVRKILGASLICPDEQQAGCMDKDMCAWNADAERCVMNRVALSRYLGQASKGNPEPVCQIISASFESACPSRSADQCESNPNCEIDEDGECTPRDVILRDAVLASDKRFRKAYKRASKKCKAKKTKKSCR